MKLAALWLVVVALSQSFLTIGLYETGRAYLGRGAFSEISTGDFVGVGPAIWWTGGFPLTVAEVGCDRTVMRTRGHFFGAPPSGPLQTHCDVTGATSAAATSFRDDFSVLALLINILLTAVPLAAVARWRGAGLPLISIPGLLALRLVPRPAGTLGDLVTVLLWALVLLSVVVVARVWGAIRARIRQARLGGDA